jgi:hypothetical protein
VRSSRARRRVWSSRARWSSSGRRCVAATSEPRRARGCGRVSILRSHAAPSASPPEPRKSCARAARGRGDGASAAPMPSRRARRG